MILLATRTLLFLLLGLVAGPGADSPDGAQLFQSSLLHCHHSGSGYAAPTLDQLHQMSRGSILLALESGRMKAQGSQLTAEERAALAEFLGTPDNPPPGPSLSPCAAKSFSTSEIPSWNSWGVDLSNSRFQPTGERGPGTGRGPPAQAEMGLWFPRRVSDLRPTHRGGRQTLRGQ